MCKGKNREERLQNAMREALSSRESAAQFLYEAGITTKSGNLRPMFR